MLQDGGSALYYATLRRHGDLSRHERVRELLGDKALIHSPRIPSPSDDSLVLLPKAAYDDFRLLSESERRERCRAFNLRCNRNYVWGQINEQSYWEHRKAEGGSPCSILSTDSNGYRGQRRRFSVGFCVC